MSEYLAIKNWDKYQPGRSGRRDWIKDWTAKDEDNDYEKLSFFQRQVLDGIRRLRGRLGKNPPNDAGYIARSMHAIPTDRPHIGHAIGTLLSRGFLVLTNQQHDESKPGKSKRKSESKEEDKPTRRVAPSDERFVPCRDVLARYHAKFVGEKLPFGVWFGARGGHQLKHLLKAETQLTIEIFELSVANRARSPSVDHAQPVYEWVAHVLTMPRGANGPGINKAQQREDRAIEQLKRVTGAANLPLSVALPSGNGRPGVGRLAGNSGDVSSRDRGGGDGPPAAQSAKAGST